jgi:alpha-beta hydrolase superfamily lysophospholipase
VAETVRFKVAVDVAPVAGDDTPARLSALVVAPGAGAFARDPAVLFCLPGGGLTKEYFDLETQGDRSFSFAEAMAQQGHVTIALDHPGVGESHRPKDGFLLTPAAVAAADAEAACQLQRRLRDGLAGLPALARFRSIGVGHSMGGMLTGFVQARHAPHHAVAILGSGVHGLVDALPETLRGLAGDPEAAQREIAPRLKAIGAAPYRALVRTPLTEKVFFRGEPAGLEAMSRATSDLIVVCGSASMTPASWAPQAAAIEVPVFVQFGDDDLCTAPHQAPAAYVGSHDVTLSVIPDMGHCHFAYASRSLLFDRFAAWLEGVRPAA